MSVGGPVRFGCCPGYTSVRMCACACVPACSLALALGECVVCSVQTEPRAGRWRDVVPPRARTNRARVWAQRRKRACWSCGECVCAEYDTAYRNFLCEILIRPNLLLALASYSASLFFSIQLSGGDRYALEFSVNNNTSSVSLGLEPSLQSPETPPSASRLAHACLTASTDALRTPHQ